MSVIERGNWQNDLNSFDLERRQAALRDALRALERGGGELPSARAAMNLHIHTFFSYNGYGYSPSAIAWKARCEGLYMAGVVDFDVLDAVDEFLEACTLLGLKGCAGIETRVFIPEFANDEINSPGEPGIAYYMGVGFTRTSAANADWLRALKTAAAQRTRGILERVNAFLAPVVLDYERDVLPLTPSGNPTERHLCMAYETKAEQLFPGEEDRAAFWAGKLGLDPAKVRDQLRDSPGFQGLLRAKTMKAGGVGYVQPDGASFPALEPFHAFILANGAIPAYAWLDGTTPGEQRIEALLDHVMGLGAAAINIIPDRNWNIKDPEARKVKVANLHHVVALAEARGLPVVVGTEMNAHGQRFVDDFDAPELALLMPVFRKGACILFAHTILERAARMGYLSPWARAAFASVDEKNAFYARLGERMSPAPRTEPAGLATVMTPADVEAALVR